jgi:hypothetical protein
VSRLPDLRLKAMNKNTDVKSGYIGGAWKNENGSISIQLDPFVNLFQDGNLVLTLFPVSEGKKASGNKQPTDYDDGQPF